MGEPLTAADLKQLDLRAARRHAEMLLRLIDDLGYVAPEFTDMWRVSLRRTARHINAIASALRLEYIAPPAAPEASCDENDHTA